MNAAKVRFARQKSIAPLMTWIACASLVTPAVGGGDPQECDPGEFPDVIVGDLDEVGRWGRVGDITAFSVGTTSCNIGTCWLDWFQSTNRHPVIGQNMYRLKTVDGSVRFEQIGMSWLKHGFYALSDDLCFTDCQPTNGSHLGVHCSDPYSAGLNAQQDNLGPRSQVNAATGVFLYPFTAPSYAQTIGRRLQVHDADLFSAMNSGALYFVEGQYITQDDAEAGNDDNNASYRRVSVSQIGADFFTIALQDTTRRELPAIKAWKAHGLGLNMTDPAVNEWMIDVPDDGRFILAAKATDLGGGTWHYEYAVQNLNSHRAACSFSVPLPAGALVSNTGFHDVDYHSGEPYDLTDWTVTVGAGAITWSCQNFDENANANALRWGTLYNFRFDVNAPPVSASVALGLFRAGSFPWIGATSVGPAAGPSPSTILGAVSRKACDVGLLPALASEPRQGGISQVRITLDSSATCPDSNSVIIEESDCAPGGAMRFYTGAAEVSCSAAGQDLTLSFSPSLENGRTYRLTLGPEVTSMDGQSVGVRGLLGDVNSDGRVNGADRGAVVSVWTGANYSCETDLDNSGRTNGSDRSIVVSAWTGTQNCAPDLPN